MHLQDAILRLTVTMSKLNMACYLLIDHIVLASKIGLVKTDTKKWSQRAAQFWLAGIIFNLARNVYDIINVIMQQIEARQQMNRPKRQAGDASDNQSMRSQSAQKYKNETKQRLVDNIPVWMDTIRNSSDVWLPMASLNYISISPGTQGVLGVISSIVGMLTVWNSSLKLVPS